LTPPKRLLVLSPPREPATLKILYASDERGWLFGHGEEEARPQVEVSAPGSACRCARGLRWGTQSRRCARGVDLLACGMPAAALKGAPVATLEDLLAIPESQRRRFELIEGSIAERGAATGEHGGAQFNLSEQLGPYNRRPGGRSPGGWWFGTEVDNFFDPGNTFRPDVAGWRRERVPERPRGTPVMVRPDWVCEILSTNKRNDLIKKKRVYHRHGVPHYWIIDPERELLTVYRWAPEAYFEILIAERGETIRAEPFEATLLQVGILFGDDEAEPPP